MERGGGAAARPLADPDGDVDVVADGLDKGVDVRVSGHGDRRRPPEPGGAEPGALRDAVRADNSSSVNRMEQSTFYCGVRATTTSPADSVEWM